MLTQCPNCRTIFRVTREILRVADGQVRCGRCQRQFDALERLIEESEDVQSDAARGEHASASSEHIEVEEPATHEEITMEGRHIEISGTYRVSDRFGNTSELKRETTEEWVEIEDEDGDVDVVAGEEATDDSAETAQAGPLDTTPEEPLRSVERIEARKRESLDETRMPVTPATESPRVARSRTRIADNDTSDELDLLTPPPRRQSIIWKILVAPLVLLLIAQWAHHHRATLARHPTIGPLVLEVYRNLGITLTPSWDLHAYQLRQWGVMSDPNAPGTLRVRASITNLADFPQPYPLLKLVLEDRWGEQVGAREFEPGEYLDPTVAPDRLLAPGQQANATITIMDPGPDADGFHFDVCLPGSNRTVCAREVPRR
ncbi:MAG: DUF3426 domain-containing protein [Gammaproteobacteria bacterium]|nr:hypothetical protein [Gammaproteobacteria bacterium]